MLKAITQLIAVVFSILQRSLSARRASVVSSRAALLFPRLLRVHNGFIAFGNKIAMNVVRNIEATCASALPTRSRSSRGPRESARRPRQGSPLPQICSDGTASRRLNILPRYTSTDKICRTISTSTKVRRKTVFQFVKMIIRLLSHTFFILNFYHIKWDFWVFRGFAISRNTQFPQYSHAISRVRQRYSKPSENEELSSAYHRLIFR